MWLLWTILGVLGAPPWRAPSDSEMETLLAAAQGPLAERLEQVTRPLRGAPYVLSPLGEGQGPDPDPRLRFDAFDCTTFVETAIALAASRSVPEVEGLLDGVRYRGGVSFGERRHLIEAAWVPDLVRAGVLEDITREIGGDGTVSEPFALTVDRWKKRRIARDLALTAGAVPIGRFELSYVPFDRLESLEVPPGTIVNIVREDVPWSPTRVTHQGLVLRDPQTGKTVVRHASPVSKRVVDEPLAKMVHRYLNPRKPKKWKPVGLSFYRVKG